MPENNSDVCELRGTINYSLYRVGEGYTVIRNKDKKGLVLATGQWAKDWAEKLRECDRQKFNDTNDYEFKTADELTDYSPLFNSTQPAAQEQGKELPGITLPDEIDIDWPTLNDETTCLCVINDGGEILLRIEDDEDKDINKWQAEFAQELCTRYNQYPNLKAENKELFQMVRDLKDCIKRLSQDDVSQFDRDKEAQWEGEAHELLSRINPNYYRNANEK